MGRIADMLSGVTDLIEDEVMGLVIAEDEGEYLSADDKQKLRRAETLDKLVDKAANLANKWGF